MRHKKKYILFLLTGIMLASGCGGKKNGKSGGSSASDENFADFEKKEKSLLAELEPLWMAYPKESVGGSWASGKEPEKKAEFQKKYSDDLEGDSFMAKLRNARALLEKAPEAGYNQIYELLDFTRRELHNLVIHKEDRNPAEEAFENKALEVHRNRFQILNLILGREKYTGVD